MKNLMTIFAIIIACLAQAQQIPNGSFENWEQKPFGEEPAHWGEFNSQALNGIFPGIVDSTIVKSQDAYSGSYAMELRSKTFSMLTSDTITPLAMLNLSNGDVNAAKMKIDSSLTSLSGYIKQDIVDSPANATTILVTVYLKGEIMGAGLSEFSEDIVEYTSFDVPIMYLDEEKGDSISVAILAGNGDFPLPGNIMWLDDFKLNYKAVPQSAGKKPQTQISVYPNPFVDQFTVNLTSSETKAFQIFSLTGKMVLNGTISSNKNTISLAKLPASTYLFIMDNEIVKLVKQQ